MALLLSPRIYNKNFKWGILPRNKIDTIVMQPIRNTPMKEASSFTQEITSVTVRDETVTLPVNLDLAFTHFGYTNNFEMGQPTTMCENYIGCVVASGSVLFALEEPLPETPTVKLHVDGITYYTNRGSLTHETVSNNSMPFTQMASWIKNNASGSEEWTDKSTDSINRGMYDDPTLIDYTAKSVPLYGWVRKIYPAGAFIDPYERNLPPAQDVLTTWVDQTKSNHWALCEHWNAYGTADSTEMWPEIVYAKGDINSTKIVLSNRTVPIEASVTKIDDYSYQVDYSIPVRYEYMASSQYYTSFAGARTYHDLDNYCFLDRISKITVELQSQVLNTDTMDVKLGLSDAGVLTNEVPNEHPLSFEQNELITQGTLWGDDPWVLTMSKYILDKFKDGKYIVECEVPAAWALKNNVHINTEMTIQLQDTTMITRNGTNCIFLVKNITKRMRSDSFIFVLSLMEV